MNPSVVKKKSLKRYNIPVIGFFANRSVRFNSIREAEKITGISYTLIFEACIGKLYKARNVYWEFENGAHYLKYKAHFLRAKNYIEEHGSFEGFNDPRKEISETTEDTKESS